MEQDAEIKKEKENFEEWLERTNSLWWRFLKSEKQKKWAKIVTVAMAVWGAVFFTFIIVALTSETVAKAASEHYSLTKGLIIAWSAVLLLPFLSYALTLTTCGIIDIANTVKRIIKLKKEKKQK